MEKVFDLDKVWAYTVMGTIAFFEPLWVLMLWFLVFVACDTITGICASIKERQIISSNKLRKTIVKLMMYSMTIVLCHAIDKSMITIVDIGLAKMVAAIICGIELYSILENCYRITGNKVFKVLTQSTLKKIKEKTGIDVEEDNLKK